MVLDPPKFARSRSSVEDALRAYHRLNRLAVNVLEPGGILVTCSCSGHVSREDFLYMLVGVAQQTGRDIQILEQRGASADHPSPRPAWKASISSASFAAWSSRLGFLQLRCLLSRLAELELRRAIRYLTLIAVHMELSKHEKRALAKGRTAAAKCHVPVTVRHIFLCCDEERAKCASRKRMQESWDYLKQPLKTLGLSEQGGSTDQGGLLPVLRRGADRRRLSRRCVVWPVRSAGAGTNNPAAFDRRQSGAGI